MATNKEEIEVWFKRIASAEKIKDKWEKQRRVEDCYAYWNGDQYKDPFDRAGDRRAMVNKIHPAVRQQIPSLYYYRPYARIAAAPEHADTPGTSVDEQAQLIQDTVNSFIRDPKIAFRDNTYLALKESFWAMGCVEVGYSATFTDTGEGKPPLKENENTKFPDGQVKDEAGLSVGPDSDLKSLIAERDRLKASLKDERFFVKFIPCKQILVSDSDKPRLEDNDWVGYWEEFPFEDIKRCDAYNTRGLQEGMGQLDTKEIQKQREHDDNIGKINSIRVYKIWDLRTNMRYVITRGFEKYLLEETYTRCPLKFLRPDIDPYHFYPRPLLLNMIGPQDEYNDSREYLRQVRKGTRPRWTYDKSLDEEQIRKFEGGDFGVMIPRETGTVNPIEPVQQPNYSDTALKTLTLASSEMAETAGIGGDPRLPQTRTATQAKIGDIKDQTLDNFDRLTVADFLGGIAEEIMYLAIDHLVLDKWVTINTAPDSPMAMQDAAMIGTRYNQITAAKLAKADQDLDWYLTVDVDSLSPVSEKQELSDWMSGIQLLVNPGAARLFAVSPELLQHTLKLMGLKSARDQQLIMGAMQAVVQMEQALAAQSQNASKGISGQPGSPGPGQPQPNPQPGSEPGPGASKPAQG